MIFEQRWRRPLHQLGSDWALADGCVVVHERSTRLVRVDPRDGTTSWDVPFGTWPRAIVVAGDRCLGITQDIARLVCLDLATGSLIWHAALPDYTGHVTVARDVVLVGGWRGYTPLMAFDLRDGKPLWRTPHPVHTVAPISVDGHVLLVQPDTDGVRLIDPADGGRVMESWTLSETVIGPDRELEPVFCRLDDRRLLVPGVDGSLWEIRLGGGVRRFASTGAGSIRSAHLAGGIVLAQTGDAQTGFAADDGRELFRLAAHARLTGLAATGFGFVVADYSGVLTAIDHDGRTLGRIGLDRRITALRENGDGDLLVLGKGSLSSGRVSAGAGD